MALELVQAHDGMAGRVMAFSGRYAELPRTAPRYTTLHLLHGSADPVMDVALIQAAQTRLDELHGDSTIDVATGLGHELHPALIQRAIVRLQTCVPLRSWEAALGWTRAAGRHHRALNRRGPACPGAGRSVRVRIRRARAPRNPRPA